MMKPNVRQIEESGKVNRKVNQIYKKVAKMDIKVKNKEVFGFVGLGASACSVLFSFITLHHYFLNL